MFSFRLTRRIALATLAAASLAGPLAARAQAPTAPDALIKQVSTEAGDVGRISALVDAKVMPYLNFQRMTASAVGRHWRTATPEQQQRLQAEFKTLLLRTYSGALTQVRDQTVQLKPFRADAAANEVVVRTEVKGKGEPIQLDYRLEKADASWKIYDVNVMGVWLVEQYKSSFSQEIGAIGIDGLIAKLAEKNKAGGKS
jgi:phospholipid transport system substrate-binding protein